jgi:hypothetical protein
MNKYNRVFTFIGILVSLLLPALTNAKAKATGISCPSNNKQLELTLILYTEDHESGLPPNLNNGGSLRWVNGWLNFSADNTNKLWLVGAKMQIGRFYPKLGSYSLSF